MADKFMPADCDHGAYFRARAEGHAPGYDIAVFARPAQWVAVADHIARITAENERLRKALEMARKRIVYYGQISERRHFDQDLKEIFPEIDAALAVSDADEKGSS